MIRDVTIETRTGNQVEFQVECSYNPPDTGGSYEGREYEQLGDDYSVDSVYRNGIDVTNRLERFCKGLVARIDEIINQS